MGVPSSEVGYTSAMPRREDHEVRKGHVGHWTNKKKKINCKKDKTRNYDSRKGLYERNTLRKYRRSLDSENCHYPKHGSIFRTSSRNENHKNVTRAFKPVRTFFSPWLWRRNLLSIITSGVLSNVYTITNTFTFSTSFFLSQTKQSHFSFHNNSSPWFVDKCRVSKTFAEQHFAIESRRKALY